MTDVRDRARPAARGLLSVEEARGRVLAAIAAPLPSEWIDVPDALGRVLAADVTATTDLPPWDNSAMDGYAILAADVAAATEDSPSRLSAIGEAAAGFPADAAVRAGVAIRIATGAPLPPGADAVIPVEGTTPLAADGTASGPRGRDASGPLPAAILVHEAVRPGDSVRRRGSDLSAGLAILRPGDELTAAAIALTSGAGLARVEVRRRPRVAVLATGDEIRHAGEPLGAAGIPDANGPGLRALVRDTGAEAIDLGIGRDRLDDVRGRLSRGIAEADAVIVSGGVSVGPYDVVKSAFDEVGEIELWRVAVQPGKPFAFGLARTPAGSGRPPVLLFGLPGNPVSSFVTFELFVRPALRALEGRSRLYRPVDRGTLTEPVSKSSGRRAFLRVRAERESDGSPARDERGRVRVGLAGGQGSHVMSALAVADALAIVPEADDSLPAGAEVALWWLDRG
jgi:molybdopterin molybdotransferase